MVEGSIPKMLISTLSLITVHIALVSDVCFSCKSASKMIDTSSASFSAGYPLPTKSCLIFSDRITSPSMRILR